MHSAESRRAPSRAPVILGSAVSRRGCELGEKPAPKRRRSTTVGAATSWLQVAGGRPGTAPPRRPHSSAPHSPYRRFPAVRGLRSVLGAAQASGVNSNPAPATPPPHGQPTWATARQQP